jgi:methionyl-tRNA formyltransferase
VVKGVYEMRVAFLGCTKYSESLLKVLSSQQNVEITRVFSIPEKFRISYSEGEVTNTNFANMEPYANQLSVPFHWINSKKGMRLGDYTQELKNDDLDIILVLGWYYMIPKEIRELARHGAWGIHASLLPNYAGGAPLVWAMIKGEKQTGVTLFNMDDGVDDGDIIEQESFNILDSDTIKEVYEKATEASKGILKKVFNEDYKLTFKPQNKSQIKVYPQRSEKDGEIDWSKSPKEIDRFIRAQTRPYPGAWTVVKGKKVRIWDAKIIEDN